MKKFLSLFAAVLFAGSMMAEPVTVEKTMNTIVSDNSYTVSSGSDVTCYTSFALDANITISTTGNPNCGSFWGTTTKDWRLYQNQSGNIIISAADGYTINKITITYNQSNSGTLKDGNTSITSGTEKTIGAANKTYTVGNTGTATNGQVKVTKIKVIYESNASCTSEVDVHKVAAEHGDFNLSAESVCADGDGGQVSVTNIVPEAGYRFKEIQATKGTVDNANKKVTGIKEETEISVIFEVTPSHKIHFNTNGVAEIADQTVLEGATFAITDAINEAVSDELGENCTYNTFVGWTLSSSIADASVKPSLVSSITMSTSDVTLYAVYSQVTGSSDEVTINFGYSNWGKNAQFSGTTYDVISQEVDGVTVTDTRNTSNLYANSTTTRFYGANELTFESDDNITSIEFTVSTYQSDITSDVGNCVSTSNEWSWSGSAQSVTFTRSGSSYAAFSQAVVTVGSGTTTYSLDAQCVAPTVEKPTISGEANFEDEVEVTITAEAGATIYYTLDGTDPTDASTEYTAAFTLDATTTVKAIAKIGSDVSAVAEKTFTKLISLTEFITNKPTSAATLKDLTVIFADNKSTYVIDKEGVALVMFDNSKTYYDGTLTAGKVLSGQKATYTSYKNQDEIIPTNAVVATDGVAPVPTLLNVKPTTANVNQYVAFNNVAATNSGDKYYIYEDVQLYGAKSSLKPAAAGNYDLEGIIINFDGNQLELIVLSIEESTTTAIDNAAVEGKAVKFIENGQLFIEKAGVRYNVMGQIIK